MTEVFMVLMKSFISAGFLMFHFMKMDILKKWKKKTFKNQHGFRPASCINNKTFENYLADSFQGAGQKFPKFDHFSNFFYTSAHLRENYVDQEALYYDCKFHVPQVGVWL